jgi:hypothetical protein
VSSANGEMYVRTNAEINQASSRVRNDLVSILMEAIDELSVSTKPRLAELDKFEKLLSSAARLFQWPTMQATRYLHTGNIQAYGSGIDSNSTPNSAVNLALIATTPEQLAVLAKGKFSADPESKPLESPPCDQP